MKFKLEEAVAQRTTRGEVEAYLKSFKEVSIEKLGDFIGQGFTHNVYEYGRDELVKIPKKGYFKKQEKSVELKKSYELCRKVLPEYVWPSHIYTSTRGYIIVQKKIPEFEPLTQNNSHEVRDQFLDVVLRNRTLVKDYHYSIDFTGFGGFKDFFQWIVRRNTLVSLSNFAVTGRRKKRLIISDFQLLQLHMGSNPFKNLYRLSVYHVSFLVNKAIVLWVYNVDIGTRSSQRNKPKRKKIVT